MNSSVQKVDRISITNLRRYEVILKEMNEAQTGVNAEDQVKGGDEQDDRKKEFNGWRKDAIFEVVLKGGEMN